LMLPYLAVSAMAGAAAPLLECAHGVRCAVSFSQYREGGKKKKKRKRAFWLAGLAEPGCSQGPSSASIMLQQNLQVAACRLARGETRARGGDGAANCVGCGRAVRRARRRPALPRSAERRQASSRTFRRARAAHWRATETGRRRSAGPAGDEAESAAVVACRALPGAVSFDGPEEQLRFSRAATLETLVCGAVGCAHRYGAWWAHGSGQL